MKTNGQRQHRHRTIPARVAAGIILVATMSPAFARPFPYQDFSAAVVSNSGGPGSLFGPAVSGTFSLTPNLAAIASGSYVSGSDAHLANAAVGAEYHWTARRNLDLLAGLEFVHYSASETVYFPGVGLLAGGGTSSGLDAHAGARYWATRFLEVDGYLDIPSCAGCSAGLTAEGRYYLNPSLSLDGILVSSDSAWYGTTVGVGLTYVFGAPTGPAGD
ncbi:MAG: hypothetical protein ACYCQK_05330 [Acidiferrobacteraceae bacterium]